MDKLGDFRCWRWQVQENLLSISVCLFVQRFALQGLSMLRNISERPKEEREKVFILSCCRKPFMFSFSRRNSWHWLRPKFRSREQRIEKVLDMWRKTRHNELWKTYQCADLSLEVWAFHSLKQIVFYKRLFYSGAQQPKPQFGSWVSLLDEKNV